jgi:hypothetical protein
MNEPSSSCLDNYGLWTPSLGQTSGHFLSAHAEGVEMLRPICLALFCLGLVGALFAVRSTIATQATAEPVFAGLASEVIPQDDDAPPLAKADKLPSVDLEAVKRTVSVVPIEVTPAEKKTNPAEKKLKEASKAEETISWHWHEGSKISKRTGKLAQ